MRNSNSGLRGGGHRVAVGAAGALAALAVVVVAVIALVMTKPAPTAVENAGQVDEGVAPVPISEEVAQVYENLAALNGGDIPEVYADAGTGAPRFIMGAFTDRTIESEADALAALDDVAPLFGADSLSGEFESAGVGEYQDVRHYRMQQVHDGVPVYGAVLLASVDADGKSTALSGEYLPGIDVSAEPTLDLEEALTIAAEELGMPDAADVDSGSGSAQGGSAEDEGDPLGLVVTGLTIYRTSTGDYELCWQAVSPTRKYFVSAQTGEVVGEESLACEETVVGKGKDVDGNEITFNTVKQSDSEYILRDEARNLVVYDGNRNAVILKEEGFYDLATKSMVAKCLHFSSNLSRIVFGDSTLVNERLHVDGNRSTFTLVDREGTVVAENTQVSMQHRSSGSSDFAPETNRSQDWGNSKAITLLKYTADVHDFYAGPLIGRQGFDGNGTEMSLYYDAAFQRAGSKGGDYSNLYGENAMSCWDTMQYGYSYDMLPDVVAHEFTHSVEGTISAMVYKGESGALKEAYADIMAVYACGGTSWMHGNNRDLADPSKTNTATRRFDDRWADASNLNNDNGGVHTNCTVIGHVAYLMSDAGISDDDMARVWYHSMFYLSPNADFHTCRNAVIAAARDLGFSEADLDIIRSAFDEVNVRAGSSSSLSPTAQIHGFSATGEVYEDFHVTLGGFGAVVGKRFDYDAVDGVVELGSDSVSEDDGIAEGYYRLDISDAGGANVLASFVVHIEDRGQGRLDVHLGADQHDSDRKVSPDGLTREVVLVLDNSGSMAGESIAEMEAAAVDFADVVFAADASVSVVAFNSGADEVVAYTESRQELKEAVSEISAGGGTNIEDGLRMADQLLMRSKADKKIILLMSDGMPTYGKTGQDLIDYAGDIKDSDVQIYSLGFFTQLSDREKADAQELLEGIASEAGYYDADDVSQLRYLFGDVADAISGTDYTYVRIACPVNVTVAYNGEILRSSDSDRATRRTSFGTLTYELVDSGDSEGGSSTASNPQGYSSGSTDDDPGNIEVVKVLRLKSGPDYNITIDGYDEGTMNYTIGFVDDKGDYSDMRTFKDIKVADGTHVETGAGFADQVTMTIDSDGDGRVDEQYVAGVNEEAQLVAEAKSAPAKSEAARPAMYIAVGAFGALAVIAVVTWAVLFRSSLRARRR